MNPDSLRWLSKREFQTAMWLYELCHDRNEQKAVHALVDHAQAILKVAVNPYYDRDDWADLTTIPTTPSLN